MITTLFQVCYGVNSENVDQYVFVLEDVYVLLKLMIVVNLELSN